MPAPKSTHVCISCREALPRDAFDNRYKPDGRPRGKKPVCRRCMERTANETRETTRLRIANAYLPNPSGICQCGCGAKVPRARVTRHGRGWIKGEYVRFAIGHGGVISTVEYIEEDRGYETPCWIWQRGMDGHGYGAKYFNNRMDKAHRMYYREMVGEIPEGFELHHQCGNRACVNPSHLQPMSRNDHMEKDGRLDWLRQKFNDRNGHRSGS